MAVKFNVVRLQGPWADGYVLDRHTISSTPTGDPYYPFDTKRTELGELLFQLKYRNKLDVVSVIVDTAEEFVRKHWEGLPRFDCIVPAPASVGTRTVQPVMLLARELAARFGVPTREDAVVKAKATDQMKNISDWAQRRAVLADAIQKGEADVRNKCILLFDDLTESGSTLGRVTEVLLKDEGASAVYALVLTRAK